jgi:hypothetical protein
METLIGLYKGFKVHAALFAAMLVCLATFLGMFPSAQGQAMAVALLAVATSLRQFATTNINSHLEELLRQNAQAAGDRPEARPPEERPDVVKFPGFPVALIFLLGLCAAASAQDVRLPVQTMDLQISTRGLYQNPDGSCVQCSIGMAGAHCNDLNAACLLWDTEFGPAVRGGSWPSRVESYCRQRGIRCWSVTGATVDDTWPWLEWAARTGRFAAIGAGEAHFQTLYGYDPGSREWLVCNNNSTDRIDRYSEGALRDLHQRSGPWVVILERPSSPAPELRRWWK